MVEGVGLLPLGIPRAWTASRLAVEGDEVIDIVGLENGHQASA